jgi:Helix-turn-helix domain
MSTLRAYKYRLYPSKKQAEKLQWTLDRCRELYNAPLQERRDAWHMCKVSINYNQQAAQLPEIKAVRPEYHAIHSQVLQDVLRRVKKAFDAFFFVVSKRDKRRAIHAFRGMGAMTPSRFHSRAFSLTEDNRVCLSNIDTIKVKFPKGKKANPL